MLMICASAVVGQALVAVLTYVLPQLCDEPHKPHDPPMLAVYAVVVSATIAGNLLVAEVVGLIPARYANAIPCTTSPTLHELIRWC